jgi:hypothetical protein
MTILASELEAVRNFALDGIFSGFVLNAMRYYIRQKKEVTPTPKSMVSRVVVPVIGQFEFHLTISEE